MSQQMQKIHDKIAECDREAALRGFSDTGFPRLWFSALSRVAGLELARPPRSKCVNPGDGSIPSPVARDTSPVICELQQQNDELREQIARLRQERLTNEERGAINWATAALLHDADKTWPAFRERSKHSREAAETMKRLLDRQPLPVTVKEVGSE